MTTTKAETPALAVIQLSDSFSAVWADLATELEIAYRPISRNAEAGRAEVVAVIVAAGGEEDRALDELPAVRVPSAAPFYVVGARESHRFAAEAVRRGAADYFALPGDLDLLRRTLEARVQSTRERVRRFEEVRQPADPFREVIGTSPAFTAALDKARRILSRGDVTVLLTGETGTGKEVFARALHDGSPRAVGPFIPVNCAAIPSQLLESELFGHERGSFTDAHQAKPGLFEEADGGTLFLDEVGHLPLALQGKLLRALEEHRVRRVGATQSRAVNVRIIAASNVDLAAAAERGEFRQDLFYRLDVISIMLPPLRDRGGDIELLAEAFLAALAQRYALPRPALTPGVQAKLRAHSWPGNVRELRHAIERALLLSPPGTLNPAELTSVGGSRARPGVAASGTLAEIIAQAVQAALERHGGNKSAAARTLGISRQRLQRILENTDDAGA